eukprot:TRINITY_DN12184_c0_g1_i1.p1 TRINITY_DN12184_c0_g1~~TRINITY_DN12184_c0_g1_i1.p1  ORF type:complete len:1414 (+),score=296.41 TRINITY_DN12184_c0_g1_i1:630-4871(+)
MHLMSRPFPLMYTCAYTRPTCHCLIPPLYDRLVSLDASGNAIRTLQPIAGLANLERLAVAGNCIDSFQDLACLRGLRKLKELSLVDASHAPNPVCHFPNYHYFTAYTLSQLEVLDGQQLSASNDFKNNAVESIHAANMNASALAQQLRDANALWARSYLGSINRMIQTFWKRVQRHAACLKLSTAVGEEAKDMEDLMLAFEDYQDDCHQVLEVGLQTCHRLSTAVFSRSRCKSAHALLPFNMSISDMQEHLNELPSASGLSEWRQQLPNRLLQALNLGKLALCLGAEGLQWYDQLRDQILNHLCDKPELKAIKVLGLRLHRAIQIVNHSAEQRRQDYINRQQQTTPTVKPVRGKYGYTVPRDKVSIPTPSPVDGNIPAPVHDNDQPTSGCPEHRDGGLWLWQGPTDSKDFDKAAARIAINGFEGSVQLVRNVHQVQAVRSQAKDYSTASASSFVRVLAVHVMTAESDSTLTSLSLPAELCNPTCLVDLELCYKELKIAVPPLPSAMVEDATYREAQQQRKLCISVLESEMSAPRLKDWFRVETLDKLTELSLPGIGLTSLPALRHLINVERIDVSGNMLRELALRGLPKLKLINASGNDVGHYSLDNLPSLESLDLSCNDLRSVHVLAPCREFGSLKHINVSSNPFQELIHGPDYVADAILTLLPDIKVQCGVVPRTDFASTQTPSARRRSLSARASFDVQRTSNLFAIAKPANEAERYCLGFSHPVEVLTHLSKDRHSGVVRIDPEQTCRVPCSGVHGDALAEPASSAVMQTIAQTINAEQLTMLTITRCSLRNLSALQHCNNVKTLDVSFNLLHTLADVVPLTKLTHLLANHNAITTLSGLNNVSSLQSLAFSFNFVQSLAPLAACKQLEQLYTTNNSITNLREIFHLRALPALRVLDICHNPHRRGRLARAFVLHHLGDTLQQLDHKLISADELAKIHKRYKSTLTVDHIVDLHGEKQAAQVQALDLPKLGFKDVRLTDEFAFDQLISLNLERNNLTMLDAFARLRNLRVLCLIGNKVRRFSSRPSSAGRAASGGALARAAVKRPGASDASPKKTDSSGLRSLSLAEMSTRAGFVSLEVLMLADNGITHLKPLELHRLPRLKSLFLEGNDIGSTEGLAHLQALETLVLDSNRVKQITADSLPTCVNLRELHLSHNRLQDVSTLAQCEGLEELFLTHNRLSALTSIVPISRCELLRELHLGSNDVMARLDWRLEVMFHFPQLMALNGMPILDGDRDHAIVWAVQHGMVEDELPSRLGGNGFSRNESNDSVASIQLTFQPLIFNTRQGHNQPAPPSTTKGTRREAPRSPQKPRTKSRVRSGRPQVPSRGASVSKLHRRRSSQPSDGPILGPLTANLALGPSLSSRALHAVPPISARMVQQLKAPSSAAQQKAQKRRQPSAAARHVLPHWSAR